MILLYPRPSHTSTPQIIFVSGFCFWSKHFSSFLLARIPVLLLGQALSGFYACLDSIFVLQASAFRVLRLPGFQFCFWSKHFLAFPLAWSHVLFCRQALSGFSACLDFVFASGASSFRLFCLPGLMFCSSGKRFSSFTLASFSFLFCRQAFFGFHACLDSSFVFQAVN